jgi:TolB protein
MRVALAIAAAIALAAGVGARGTAPRPAGWIVFNALANGPGYEELFVADLDSGRVRQLTHSGGYNPSWSPEGSQVAFEWVSGGPCGSPACSRIWLNGAEGSNRRPFTPANLRCESPAWSPAGDRIAYVQWRRSSPSYVNRSSIYTRTIGGEVHRLTNANAFDANPVWSPDGSQIVFSRDGKGLSGNYVMNADGSNQHRLQGNPGTVIESWSPDGRLFAGWRSYGQYNNRFLSLVLNADGTGERRLLGGGLGPVWSPDDRFIAFIPENQDIIRGSVGVIQANATGRRQLFEGPFTQPENLDWHRQP